MVINFFATLKHCLGSILKWQKIGCTAVWAEVNIQQSSLIPILYEQGFKFHHAEGNSSMLYKWLDEENDCRLPRFATHQVGVSGEPISGYICCLIVRIVVYCPKTSKTELKCIVMCF